MRLFISGTSASSARRCQLSLAAISLAIAFIAGCDRQPITAIQAAKTPSSDSPEDKLKRVMQRLRSALVDAQAAAGSGVVSQRKSSYRLIPPREGGDDYRAEVTIVTQTKLDTVTDDRSAATGPIATGDEAAPGKKGPSATPSTAESRKPLKKTEKFILVYEDDRWRLLEEPEGKTEQILFDYALDL